MKPRGVKKLEQNENGNYIAVCNDGSVWITHNITGLGKADWIRVTPVPKVD